MPRVGEAQFGACCGCLTTIFSIILCAGAIAGLETYSISTYCTGVLLWPMISLCIFLLVILILGCVAMRHEKDDRLKLLHLVSILLMIVALAAFIIFGYVAVGGSDFSRVKVREYKLTEFRGAWLKRRVAHPQRWATISACIRRRHACKNLVRGMHSEDSGGGPTALEFGCCMPPTSCAFTYVNGTTWVPKRTPAGGASSSPPVAMGTNADCSRWSSDQDELCFQCDSCKAAFLYENKKGWTIAVAFPIITLALLIVLLIIYLRETK